VHQLDNKVFETVGFIDAYSLEVLTDLACLTSGLRVPQQAWGTSNETEHCHYIIRLTH